MKFIPLASSSHGNAYILDDGESKILIECGLTYKKLQQLAGFRTCELTACLISHEHKDHSGCWAQLLKNGTKIYSSAGTAAALDSELFQIIEAGEPLKVGSFDVLPFETFHDAAEPLGFLIQDADGEKIAFATDTVNLRYQFPGVNVVAIECNYDENILSRAERIPEKVRHRIRNAHMSIDRTVEWLYGLDKSCLREVFLMHLSDACGDERYFLDRVVRAVGSEVHVTICPR